MLRKHLKNKHLTNARFYYYCSLLLHCVRKKVTPCGLFYNTGKWCRISTKFCINNATSNCRQTAKFQQNLSTTATVTV